MSSFEREGPFHLPKLSTYDLGLFRLFGPGLGNLLFPISRAIIGQNKMGGKFIYPTMRQFKIGPILRWESDFRTYGSILRPRTLSDWKFWLDTQLKQQVSETCEFPGVDDVIYYEGLGRHFHDLSGRANLIGTWLQNERVQDQPICGSYDIAIHVRLGDFASNQFDKSTHNVRQEFDWYRSALDFARKEWLERNVRVRLFTDGAPATVERSLKLTGHIVDTSKNALTAILNMAQAKCIITSRSSFSMWGVFLGNTHAIWDDRFDWQRTFPSRPGLDIRH
jgi:hypothetical protein